MECNASLPCSQVPKKYYPVLMYILIYLFEEVEEKTSARNIWLPQKPERHNGTKFIF
jgi:hypothetical protein